MVASSPGASSTFDPGPDKLLGQLISARAVVVSLTVKTSDSKDTRHKG